MLPANPTTEQRDQYVWNIIAAYERATPDQLTRGAAWYPAAHTLAAYLADGDVRKGAGVIAALSPMKLWTLNQKLAADALSGNPHGHMGDAMRKVNAILAGADPAEVLPMNLKTGNFYRNIADPSDPVPVTIDRHAHDVAGGLPYDGIGRRSGKVPPGLGNVSRYNSLADAYRTAAESLGMLPNVLQAVVWLVQIESK